MLPQRLALSGAADVGGACHIPIRPRLMLHLHPFSLPRLFARAAQRLGGWGCILLLTAFTMVVPEWRIDPTAMVRFSTRSASGTFSGFSGRIYLDPSKLSESRVELELNAATIHTGNDLKDKHARGSAWLDVERYPKIRFASTRLRKSEDIIWADGTLELHGVRKSVSIPVRLEQADDRITARGRFSLNREDYGIEGNGLAFVVGSTLTLDFVLPLQRMP